MASRQAERLYAALLARRARARVAQAQAPGTLTVSRAADVYRPPDKPDGPVTEVPVTLVTLAGRVEVAVEGGWLRLWAAGHEVRIGPLTPNQLEQLGADAEYDDGRRAAA